LIVDNFWFVVDDLSVVETANVATDPTFLDCVCAVVEVADHDLFAA
jgi:hypothetical protein